MVTSEIALDPERQKQAKAYDRISRRLMVVDLALGSNLHPGLVTFGLVRGVEGGVAQPDQQRMVVGGRVWPDSLRRVLII